MAFSIFIFLSISCWLTTAASNIKNELHYVFSEADNCTEALRRDKLRKTDYVTAEDRGIIQHVCSQVFVLDAKHNALTGFKSSELLGSLRNRHFALTGDSLGRQFFVGLISSLSHEEHTFAVGNTTLDVHDDHKAAFTFYVQYNTTIIWCRNDFITHLDDKSWLNLCGNRLMNSDYIVLSYGAWYKPMHWPPYNNPALTYKENQAIALREYNRTLYASRETILAVNPRAQLIYRTHPHVGGVDEANWNRCNSNQTLCTLDIKSDIPSYWDGWAWSQVKLSANWTIAQNKVLHQFVHHIADAILLDWFHLSLASFAYFNHLGVPTHTDALHYCSEGLPRLASLLLQLALTSRTSDT